MPFFWPTLYSTPCNDEFETYHCLHTGSNAIIVGLQSNKGTENAYEL